MAKAKALWAVFSLLLVGLLAGTVAVSGDVIFHDTFAELPEYTVTATASEGGSIDPASRTVDHGSTTTFTVTPDTGYSIDTVGGTCGGSLDGDTYTTGEITADCTVTAEFSVNTYSVTLNDTGIDLCANNGTNNLSCPVASHAGQDGDHGRDALARDGQLTKVGAGAAGFDYTKLDAGGNDLSKNAKEWSCVRDNHTGLIWEVKVDNPSHLRHRDHTYTWYNPDTNSNGGTAGTQNGGTCAAGSACDTAGFVQAVNNQDQGLCGASDWRMPTRMELHSLTHQGRSNPSIDTNYFPQTASSGFWSASPYAGSSGYAWVVSFFNGGGFRDGRSGNLRVRLVRGGQ